MSSLSLEVLTEPQGCGTEGRGHGGMDHVGLGDPGGYLQPYGSDSTSILQAQQQVGQARGAELRVMLWGSCLHGAAQTTAPPVSTNHSRAVIFH
mgnify:CR=1 FL=1